MHSREGRAVVAFIFVVSASVTGAAGARAGEAPETEGPQTTRLRLAAKELLARIGEAGVERVWTVAKDLGGLGDEVAPILAAELDGAGDVTKLAVARALCLAGELGLGRRTLLELARGAVAPEVRVLAARAVAMADEPVGLEHVADALTLILNVEEVPIVRAALADAVLRMTGGWQRSFAVVGDDAGIDALGQRSRAIEALREILRGDDEGASREAALVLGERPGDRGAHPPGGARLGADGPRQAGEPDPPGREPCVGRGPG